MGETVLVIMPKAVFIPSHLLRMEILVNERSLHWNLIVFEESFVLGGRTLENPQKCFLLYFKCAENTRLWLYVVIVLH